MTSPHPQSAAPFLFRYTSLDHWRGLAALLVLGFHCFWAMEANGWGEGNPVLRYPGLLFHQGWMGVHLFFVISGYCITGNLCALLQKGDSCLVFWRDRLLRIYPPFLVALVATLAINATATSFGRAMAASPGTGKPYSLLADALLISPYAGTTSMMIVSWTLVIEVGFYGLCGAAMLIPGGRARAGRILAAFLLLVLPCLFLHPGSSALAVFRYWPEFVCGAVVYFALASRSEGAARPLWQAWLLLALLAGGDYLLRGLTTLHLAAPFAALLIFLAPFDVAIAQAGALRWLGYAGAMSYSLYLIHAPLVLRVSNLGRRFLNPASAQVLWLLLAMGIVGLLGGFVFYRMVERPYESWRRRFFKARMATAAVGPNRL